MIVVGMETLVLGEEGMDLGAVVMQQVLERSHSFQSTVGGRVASKCSQKNPCIFAVLDNSVADSTSLTSPSSERNGSTSVNVPPKYGGELAEFLQTHNHEEIIERLKHMQLGDRTKYR